MAGKKKKRNSNQPAPELAQPEEFDLDGVLSALDRDLLGEDTIRIGQDALREKLEAGETMPFRFPEEPAPVEKKPQKRRGKGAWGRKKAKRKAREELEKQSSVTGDTVRLDTGIIAAKAAEMDEKTVRFSVPASQEAAERDPEEPTVRLYSPGEKDAPQFREEGVLTRQELEEMFRDTDPEKKENGESPALKLVEKREKSQRTAAAYRAADKQYEEAVTGQGGAQTRLFLAGVFACISLLLTAFSAFDLLRFQGGDSFLPFLQMVLLLLCALMTYDVVAEGLLRLLRLRPDLHTVLFVTFVFSVADGIQCIMTGRSPYTALVCLELTMALWANCQERNRICDTMEVARRGGAVDGALREPDLWGGKDGVLRGPGNMEDFLTAQERRPRALLAADLFGLGAMAVSAALSGVVCGGSFMGFARCFTGMMLAATPALAFVAVSRPRSIAARRLKQHGAALAGWDGVKNTRGSLVIPLSDNDLFPGDKLRMNGIKLYPEVDPDKTIAYGAAAICASGSGLAGIFTELVERRGLRKCQVSNLRRYDSGGISADVGPDSVLAGALPFMQAMGVELPQGTQVNQAVYVAVNGFLGGVFAVNYAVTRASLGGLGTLVHSGGVTPVLTAQDFVITPEFLQSRFKVNVNKLQFPSPRERAALEERKPSEEAKQCAILTKPEFASLAKTVACGRALYGAAWWSTAVNLFSGAVGLAIAGVLAWIGALDTMTAGNLLLYALVWSVPVWILGSMVHSA